MFPAVMRLWWIGGVAALCAMGVACGGGGGSSDEGEMITGVTLDEAFNGRNFTLPVKLVQHPTLDTVWYVVEQSGRIRRFSESGTSISEAANIPVETGTGIGCTAADCNTEQGLLGMAFDPFFASSGEIYVFYTDSSDESLVVQRWVSSNNGDTFNDGPIILRIPHAETNHNGGDLAFGPSDGFLYISTGDGGGNGDPSRNAQNKNVLLGKILRIDVNGTIPAGKTYAIPSGGSGNPFSANAQCNTGPGAAPCPEIYAFGFRNPWRMNFDPPTSRLYLGDVGQSSQEEIDLVTRGGNFGWNCFEGELAFNNVPACALETFVAPEVVYHRDSSGNAVTGGAVYRGTAIPGLRGFYLYTDYFFGPIFAFDTSIADAPAQPTSASETGISAFGQGRDGEVYAVDHDDGVIRKIVPSAG